MNLGFVHMDDTAYFSPYKGSTFEEVVRAVVKQIGLEAVLNALSSMLTIRHFETRGEAAYKGGLVGGFCHSYSGQEAIQAAVVQAVGKNNWYTATYRCHGLAFLLGASPNEMMAELFGRATGNTKGRGGSMHMCSDRMLGGFAIVGGQLPIAVGAAFSLKYLKQKEVSVCFLGDGAVAQGSFHESLNLASLWDLPVIFIIENNKWGMGTHVTRALSSPYKIAEKFAPGYNMNGYTLNGMDFFNCYAGFSHIHQEVLKSSRPVLVECVCERFRGHSISDPETYRTKEELKVAMEQDPILILKKALQNENLLTEEQFGDLDKMAKKKILEALDFAEKSPWPSIETLGEDVYAS